MISHLSFPFLSLSFSFLPVPLTSAPVSTRARTIFAPSPASPCTTSPPRPPRAPPEGLLPASRRGPSRGRAPTITGVLAKERSGAATQEMRFSLSARVQQPRFLKGKPLRGSPLHTSSFGFRRARGLEIVPRASCDSPRK